MTFTGDRWHINFVKANYFNMLQIHIPEGFFLASDSLVTLHQYHILSQFIMCYFNLGRHRNAKLLQSIPRIRAVLWISVGGAQEGLCNLMPNAMVVQWCSETWETRYPRIHTSGESWFLIMTPKIPAPGIHADKRPGYDDKTSCPSSGKYLPMWQFALT